MRATSLGFLCWRGVFLAGVFLTDLAAAADERAPVPVIFDTDIGTDIDDAYALAALIHRPDLQLLGVTTVSSDAVARARLAAKLLHVAGGEWARVPVYAGISTPTQYMKQVEWATGFSAPSLHTSGGVDFMKREIDARPGKVTLIAVGELTNVAALLDAEPGIAKKIRAISLMGGTSNQMRRRRKPYFVPAYRCWLRRSIPPRISGLRPRCVSSCFRVAYGSTMRWPR
jgi:hypothetical protein